MSLIVAVIISLVVGAAFWGVWVLLGRIANPVVSTVAGIILILIWLVVTLHVTGIYKL